MGLLEINKKTAAGRKELERLKVLPFAKIVKNKSVKSDFYNRFSQSVKEMKEGKTKPIEQLFKGVI
jgi:histone H3/H4